MNALRKYWIWALLAAVLTLAMLDVYNLARVIGQPFGGFYASRSHSSNIWQVDAPTPPWWQGLTATELRYDDVLVALDGQPFSPTFYQIYAGAYQAGRTVLRLDILRDGQPMRLDVPIRIFSLSNFFELKFPDLLIGLGFWLLAVAVYRARPDEPVNRIFAIASALCANALWLTIPALFTETGFLTQLLQIGWCLGAPFVGAAFIHMSIIFPDFARRQPYGWFNRLYGVMALFAGMYALSFFLRWSGATWPVVDQLSTAGNVAALGIFGVSAGFYTLRLLWLISQTATSRRVRRQVEILLLGMALALPYILIIVIRSLVRGTHSYFWNELDLRYLVLAVPLSFAFVILRYQTFQRNPPALFSTFMIASSAIVASLGAWILRVTEPQWINTLNLPPFVPLFFVALLSSIFWSLQSSWRGVFSRLFQWEGRSYVAVRQFGQAAVREMDLQLLPNTITSALVSNLELERAAIWLWDDRELDYTLAGQAGKWPEPPLQRLSPPAAPVSSESVRIQPSVDTVPAWLAPLGRNGLLEVTTQLAISGRPIGLLGIGKRWDEEILDERDLQIIELIAQQSTLFLVTALDIEQLRQVPQQITIAQERERFKIAQELHDTVQQFLGRLPFFLDVARSSARANPAESESILAQCIADVESAAQTVRQIRNNLAPMQLEKSFSQPLMLLLEHFRAHHALKLDLHLAPDVDADLSPEARHALYRVVQQALDNAAEHARANLVSIVLIQQDGLIHFTITDDGQGFSDHERSKAETGGSFGLKSMEARITSLGGEFSIQSAPGNGTRISGWLPVSLSGAKSGG